MLAADSGTRIFPAGTRVVSTSSGLAPEVATVFEARYGMRVDQVYGLIEVGLPIGTMREEPRSSDSVGRALPGYEVAILDEAGLPLSAGVIGKLAVRGPGMFDAYLAPYRPLASVLVNGWFLTGDLATQSENGAISVCGREKSVINSGGNKVFPEEIERVMNSFPGVRASRAFGSPHPMLGEVVFADIVPITPGAVDVEALRRYCVERLSGFKVPKEIRLVQSLPVTDSGKIVRAA
jgi:acyl-coenzyme A synthetase/AMP-(fatty) acid ligase